MRKIKSFPVFLIMLGFIILLDTSQIYNGAFAKLWPVILIGLGVVKIINSFIEEKR